MNPVSAILRIVCGLAVLITAYSIYSRNREPIAAGEPLQLFGQTLNASPGLVTAGFALIALFGLFLVGLGVASLLKTRP